MNLSIQEILTQAGAFILLVWVLKKLAWKPLLALLDERQRKIRASFEEIERTKQELEKLKADYERSRAHIEEEARQKLQQAIDEGKRVSRELQESSRREAQAVLEKAKEDITLEIAKAKITLRNEIADLTLQATERLLYRHPPSVALDRLIATLPHAALERCASELERLLGTSRAPKEDEGGLVMSESELRACAEQGMSLGAHTRDHVVLTHERPARIWRELHPPRRELEAISGRACTSFAYCNGHLSDDLVAAVRRAGYTLAVTTHDAPNLPGQDLFRLRRKVLWDNHVRTLEGRFSPALAAAHLHGLFQRTA